ncbi:CsbD family protein [Kitasatospora mediocidica]|uniref:CsbD family protein n=1 Tax=Kitasatospora mediocidica TaxID=58352 RepID=UPI0005659E0F|nr:CsbD family protein [Kitasatospora mediocidica]
MGEGDKVSNMADKAKGKAKEAAGKAVGNERLVAEGKGDQVRGDAKQAGEKVKDAVKDVLDR